jgi:hypothetical protein
MRWAGAILTRRFNARKGLDDRRSDIQSDGAFFRSNGFNSYQKVTLLVIMGWTFDDSPDCLLSGWLRVFGDAPFLQRPWDRANHVLDPPVSKAHREIANSAS